MTELLTDTQPIRLKGRSFLALVLSPEQPFDHWLMRLNDLAERSAGFFLRRPIVLDVEGIDLDRQQLRSLLDQLVERGIRIIGIEGAQPSLLGNDMPPSLSGGLPASGVEEKGPQPAPQNAAAEPAPSLMLTRTGAIRPIDHHRWRRHGRGFGGIGCRGHRWRIRSCLRNDPRSNRCRFDGRYVSADFLPQAGGGADRHRWLLPDFRRP